jgi:sugar phosphate isomerase/epimerase
MITGISTYTYTWSVGVKGFEPSVMWNETDLLNKAAELGVSCLQIADNLPLHELPEERLNNLVILAKQKNIQLEAGSKIMTRDNLLRYISIAERIGSPILRFVIDGNNYRPEINEIVKVIKEAVPLLEEKNITLAIENHDRLKAREFEEIILRSESEHVGICLDSVNSMGAGEGIETITTVLAPYTVNLHVKEFIVERHPHMMGFTIEGRPAGEGQLPLEWMLDQLTGKCQSAILEQWTPPEKTIEQTMQKENEWAKKSVVYMKKIIT